MVAKGHSHDFIAINIYYYSYLCAKYFANCATECYRTNLVDTHISLIVREANY